MVHSFPTRRSSDLRADHGRPRQHDPGPADRQHRRSEEHTSELQSHHPISYAVFCLKKKNKSARITHTRYGFRELHPSTRLLADGEYATEAVTYRVDAAGEFFFFNDTATTEIYTGWYTLSLHDALPI